MHSNSPKVENFFIVKFQEQLERLTETKNNWKETK